MGTFIFQAYDRAGHDDARTRLREDHRKYIRRDLPDCRCILGGPLRADDGTMIGTLLVFEARDATAVHVFMRDDPYCIGAIFRDIAIVPWTIGLGAIAETPRPDAPIAPQA